MVQLLQIKENLYKDKLNEHIRLMPHYDRKNFTYLISDNYNNYIPPICNAIYHGFNDDIIDIISEIIDDINKCDIDAINYFGNCAQQSICLNTFEFDNNIVLNGVQTRSMTKKKLQQNKQNLKPKYTYTKIDTLDVAERVNLRDKLINSIYNYKKTNTLFKFKLWPQLQKSDDILKIIYQYVIDKKMVLNNENLLNEWLKIEKFCPRLFHATVKNEVKLNKKQILTIKNFNTIQSKYV